MIEAVPGPEGSRIAGSLPPGSIAYLDADWLPVESASALPAIILTESDDSDRAAGAALLTVADAVLTALSGVDRSRVDVLGRGVVAAHLRAQRTNGRSDRPKAVVDCTGDPAAIAEATRRLDDLGLLVLAGEPLGRRLSLDLYPDVHVRGLRLVGVEPASAADAKRGIPLPALFVESLRHVQVGALLPRDGGWYRISA